MMRTVGLLCAVLLLTVVACLTVSPVAGLHVLAQELLPWADIGPSGAGIAVSQVAASHDWRDGGFVLGLRLPRDADSDLVRTTDTGRTWERLPGPGPYAGGLTAIPTVDGQTVVFLTSKQTLYRSVDGGATWQAVLNAGTSIIQSDSLVSMVDILPPPKIQGVLQSTTSGVLLAQTAETQNRVFRSRDAGQSWQELTIVPAQFVQQISFSPDFLHDQTIFAAVVTGEFPPAQSDAKPRVSPETTDHERSAGVLVSRNAGESWEPANTGLSIGDTPYRHIQQVVVSPTYARDGNVFAYSWGPRGGDRMLPAWLFRSQDRGVTWEPVVKGGSHSWPNFALSPTFADDGVIVVAWASRGLTPASSGCPVLRSGDGGSNWEMPVPSQQYGGCGSDGRVPITGAPILVVTYDGKSTQYYANLQQSWMRSDDDGRTWAPVNIQGVPASGYTSTVLKQTDISGRSSVFLVGRGGSILAADNAETQVLGAYPCQMEIGAAFADAKITDEASAWTLGCARTPEVPGRIHVETVTSLPQSDPNCAERLWVEAVGAGWHGFRRCDLRSMDDQHLIVWRRPDDDSPPPNSAISDEQIRARVQRFENGLLVLLTRSDGASVTLQTNRVAEWRVVGRTQ